jgi:FkbM family methyltransferase
MPAYVSYDGHLWYDGPEVVENLPTGPHELHIIREVVGLLPGLRRGILVDVGAHYGLYTVRLARHFEQVWAFEPHPLNHEVLVRNIRANGLRNVLPLRLALWDTDGEGVLELVPGNDPSQTSGRFRVSEKGGTLVVPVRRLDALDPPEVSYIKVDVEGRAHRVLGGALNTLKKYGPAIQIEYHSEEEIRGCLEVLYGLGYSEYKRFPYPPHFLSIYVR